MAFVRKALPWALVACVTGCNGEVDTDSPRLVSVDQSVYQSTYLRGVAPYETFGFSVMSAISNPGTTELRLLRCTPESPHPEYGLVAMPGETTAYSAASACTAGVAPFVLAPGATRIDTLEISGPNAWAGTPLQPIGSLEGRVELWVREEGCLQCEPIRSRPFVVRLGRYGVD